MRSKLNDKNRTISTDSRPPLAEIMAILNDSRKVLVASHIDPDGDALGTQLAVAEFVRSLGKDVSLVRDNDIPHKYRFLNGVNDIPPVDHYRGNELFDTAVILECPSVTRIGRASRFLNDTKIINIDHHLDNSEFGDVNWLNVKASSVGEMVYELFQLAGLTIAPPVAEQLYTAVMTDTGRFRYRSTSPRTMEIAGKLIEAGADPQKICDEVYYNVLPSTMKLIGKVLNGIEFHHHGRICLLTLTQDMLRAAEAHESESDGLVDYTLFNCGVIAGALLKEIGANTTRVSFRSKDGIDVSAIASRYGGGGHFNASGCTMHMSVEDTRLELIKLLSEAIDDLG
ncbi:MAG: bifunctional oligoribonuclease/PAP phosphatase NrnA [Candidatus Zixiibacteriota bacterium]